MRAAAHAVTDAGVDAWASERLGAARAERLRHLAADPGVAPNRAFLRYIEQVLPTLGEVDVEQTTVRDLTARVPVRAGDPDELAVLKGDARMAEVLRRALWGGLVKPTDSIQVPLAGRKY